MSGCRPLQVAEVVEVAQSFGGRYAARDRALFLVGLYTGFRITELLSLRWRDCRRHGEVTAAVTVARRAMKNKQRGRTVALHPHAQAALHDWYQVAQPADAMWYVFRSRKGGNRPLTRQSAWQILLDAYASCGMTGRLGTHSLRKTFAMTVHEQLGRDLHRTQQALGHVNISSTLHYLPVADVEIQQAIVAVTYPFSPVEIQRRPRL
jgi:integrase